MEPNENSGGQSQSSEQGQPLKGKSKKLMILLGVGLGTAILGGLGYWFFSQQAKTETPAEPAQETPQVKKNAAAKPKAQHPSGGSPKKKSTSHGKTPAGSGTGSGNSVPAPVSALTSAVKERIDIAKNLWLYCTTKKLDSVLSQLDRIANVSEYTKVNAMFKTIPLKGKKQTIVSGVLTSFSDATSKQLINAALRKIGLKYNDDSGQWSLSGLEEAAIII